MATVNVTTENGSFFQIRFSDSKVVVTLNNGEELEVKKFLQPLKEGSNLKLLLVMEVNKKAIPVALSTESVISKITLLTNQQ